MLTFHRHPTTRPVRARRRGTALLLTFILGAVCTGVAWGAIGSSQITNNSLTGADIKNGSIKGADVGTGQITGVDVKDGGLTGADIKDYSIHGIKLQSGTVDGGRALTNGTVRADDLHADASADVIEKITAEPGLILVAGTDVASISAPPGTWLVTAQSDFYNSSMTDGQELGCEIRNGASSVADRDIWLQEEGEGMLYLSKVITTTGPGMTTISFRCARAGAGADLTEGFNAQLTALNTVGAQTDGAFG